MTSKRIDRIAPGSIVTLALTGPDHEDRVVLVSRQGEGESRTVTFLSRDFAGRTYTWDAYRYNGRWAYGSSADRISVLDVEPGITAGATA